jgi:superfamily I DNA/RNA helicase
MLNALAIAEADDAFSRLAPRSEDTITNSPCIRPCYTPPIMWEEIQSEADRCVQRIVSSDHRKKLIVAGPGAGKTFVFRKLLLKSPGDKDRRLTLTFINELKAQLEADLQELCRVNTFHGYCRSLLHHDEQLRSGLTPRFNYFPGLASLIGGDWQLTYDEDPPKFVGLMRNLEIGDRTSFYLKRSDYYDAVEFDDSVFRVFLRLREQPNRVEEFELVLIDEYQDFNRLEASFLALLAAANPIVIAGDDDQALYRQLRSSSPEFIRQLHGSGEYECLNLPFCMRCPEVIVGAVNDIIAKAHAANRLEGRIDKPYRYFPPRKAADSEKYPRIKVVGVSLQKNDTNYFARYVAEQIKKIPKEEIAESRRQGFPTVLVIGPVQYLRPIGKYLSEHGYVVQAKGDADSPDFEAEDALSILAQDSSSNLGWRVMLEVDEPNFMADVISRSVKENIPLVELIPDEYRNAILQKIANWQAEQEVAAVAAAIDLALTTIKLTSFEGSKGLSAQHVFIVGLQAGELPRNEGAIDDLEICKLLVALTRTRKQCQLMFTWRFGAVAKRPSALLQWINQARVEPIRVTKDYWT